jgi:hypothetical protein
MLINNKKQLIDSIETRSGQLLSRGGLETRHWIEYVL